jgi:hypothetical protein
MKGFGQPFIPANLMSYGRGRMKGAVDDNETPKCHHRAFQTSASVAQVRRAPTLDITVRFNLCFSIALRSQQ